MTFNPDALPAEKKAWWDAWIVEAATATQEVVSKWEQTGKLTTDDFDAKIWGKLKVWLLDNVFSGKCAYCETHVEQARQPGHAEHFRPKGAVKRKIAVKEKSRLEDVEAMRPDGQTIKHPGYFWLAYCWENLIPSCISCNTGQGKNNQFPVQKSCMLLKKVAQSDVARLKPGCVPSTKWPGYYYLGPRDLEAEESPLLIHPYFDNPRDHITFGIAGLEAAKSERGTQSIEVYELAASGLRRARQEQQLLAYNLFTTAFTYAVNEGKAPTEAREAGLAAIERRLGVDPPYSAAIEDFINLFNPS